MSRPLLEKPREQLHKELRLSDLVSQGMSKDRAEGVRGSGASPGLLPWRQTVDSCAGTQGCLLALTYSASVPGRLMTALSEKHIMSFIKPPVQHWSERPTLDSSTQLPLPCCHLTQKLFSTATLIFMSRSSMSWSQATTVLPVDDPKRGAASASGNFSSRGLFLSLLGV